MPRDDSSRLSRLKHNLKLRALVLDGIRDFFRSEGFLEVETPLNVEAVAPEQHIFPFTVEGRFLTTSPELHMKRLLADGYSKIFQICRCFRKGERGQLHNPEFTMLEWYRAGADYMGIVEDTERLVQSIAGKLHAGSTIRYQGVEINLERPWRRITVRQAFLDYAGWDPIRLRDPERFDTDFVEKVMPGFPLDEPTVLLDYPAEMASLSRLKPGHPEVAERAEVFIGGLEIANAYSELRDAVEQEQRFRHEIEIIKKEGKGKSELPRKFLDALPALPECGGNALGVDRLVMLFCDTVSVDEVIAFPWEEA